MSPEGTSVPILLYNLILIILYAQSARKVSQTGNLYFDVPGDKFVQFLYNFDFFKPKKKKKKYNPSFLSIFIESFNLFFSSFSFADFAHGKLPSTGIVLFETATPS